jgi:putative nucleotidyltransferase with HDIG domain
MKKPNNVITRPLAYWKGLGKQKQEHYLLFALSFVILFALVTVPSQILSPFSRMKLTDYEAGKVAEKDLIVPKDLFYLDEEATRKKKDELVNQVAPVYRVHEDISTRSIEDLTYFSTVYFKTISDKTTSARAVEILHPLFSDYLSKADINYLYNTPDMEHVVPLAISILSDIMNEGIVQPFQDVKSQSKTIEILHGSEGTMKREEIPFSSAVTKSTVLSVIEKKLAAKKLKDRQKEAALILIKSFAKENAFHDSEQTLIKIERAQAEAQPVMIKLVKGQKIVKKGFLITNEDMRKLRAIGVSAVTINVFTILGTGLTILLMFAMAVILLRPPLAKGAFSQNYIYLLLGMIFCHLVLLVLLSQFIDIRSDIPLAIFVPIAFFAMLMSILIDQRTGIVSAFLCSVSLLLFQDIQFESFFFALFSGLAGAVVVRNAEKRIELIRAGVALSGIHVLVCAALTLFKGHSFSWFFITSGLAVLNGLVCSFLNLGLLPVFEHMLNIPTTFRLIELSDMNSPIFKKMITLAPGTYAHSISVANLAESAASKIGANALLARVGAYYHDIGKIDQAEYFIENQTQDNKHDELKPSLSAAVIKSHVKMGVEKAKELGLPEEVINIISQHHGSGIISYFYMLALNSEEKDTVVPEDFSYSGEPPASKEAAIVMLADTVEAASRTLKKPTVSKLEKFVWNIIMDKINSGQMVNSELTFKELETIKKSFVQILAGNFHSRIEYPDMDEVRVGP